VGGTAGSKVKYTFKDILGIVFFGVLAGNDELSG